MEVKINKENINDFRGIELNNIFSFSYNFDSLIYFLFTSSLLLLKIYDNIFHFHSEY